MSLLAYAGKARLAYVPIPETAQIPNVINSSGALIPAGYACEIVSGTDSLGNANACINLAATRIDGYALNDIPVNEPGTLGKPGHVIFGGFGSNVTAATPYYLDPAGSGQLSTVIPASNAAALADPTSPYVVSAAAGGSFPDGAYEVYYQNKNATGHTNLVSTGAVFTSASTNNKLSIAALAFPTGVTSRDVFVETTPGSGILKFVANDTTAGVFTVSDPPTDLAAEPVESNTTTAGAATGVDQRIQAIGGLNGLLITR